jgi:XTP/dITP diphosphohydrolase
LIIRLASSNANKARELERAVPAWKIELLEADDYPPEEGETYYDNALIKARFGRTLAPDEIVLGEDSGIEAAALGGRPGIHSARWGKPGSSVDRLLHELQGQHDRRARYVCELVALLPEGTELRGRGTLEGTVANERRGTEGFGYDPVFVPEGETRTVAELGDAWKAQNSHRARAALMLSLGLPPPGETFAPARS